MLTIVDTEGYMIKRILLANDGVDIDLVEVVEFLNSVCSFLEFDILENPVQIDDEIITKSTFRKIPMNDKIERLVVFTDKEYYNNYFFETKNNLVIVSFFAWEHLTKLPKNNGVAYWMADILSLDIDSSFRHSLDDDSKPECIYDFLGDKTGIDSSMRASYICRKCNVRIKNKIKSKDGHESFNDIKNILNELGSASKWDEDIVIHWRSKVDSNRPKEKGSKKKLFISYSHADSEWLDRVKVHLKPLERNSVIEIWEDTRIQTGDNWKNEIDEALKQTGAAILLVSADFLASDFIIENELPQLLKLAEDKGTRIFQLIVSPCCFDESKNLSQFQAVNSPKSTLIELNRGDQERLLLELAKSIISQFKND